jgi:hypothetical protein
MWLIQLTGANPTSNRNSTYWWSTLLPLQPSWYPSSRTVFTNINWVNASAWTYPKLNEPHWGLNIHWIMVRQIIEYVSRFFVNSKKNCPGKVSNRIGHIRSRRLTRTSKNTLTPFYGVQIVGSPNQVCILLWPPESYEEGRGGQCGDNTSTRNGRGGCRVEVLIKSRFLNNLFFTWS